MIDNVRQLLITYFSSGGLSTLGGVQGAEMVVVVLHGCLLVFLQRLRVN